MNSTKFTIFLVILGSLCRPLEATVTDSPEDHDGRARICDIVYPCQPRPHSRIDSLLFCVKVILPDDTYRQVDFTDKVCLFNNRCKFGKHRVAYCHVGKCGSEYPPACEPGYENDSLGFDPRPRNCPTLPPSPPPLLPQPTPAPDWRPATIPPEWPSDRLPQPPPPPSQPPPPPQRPPIQPPPPPQRPPFQPPAPTSEPPFQSPTWPTVGPPVNNPDDIFGTPSTPDRPKTTGPKPKPGQPSFPSIWDDYDIKDHPVAPHSLKESSMDSSDDDWDDKESLG